MNFRLTVSILGKLLVLFSFSFSVPLIAAYIFDNPYYPFLIPAALSLLTGAILGYGFKTEGELDSLRHKESFAIVGLIWLLMSIFAPCIHPVWNWSHRCLLRVDVRLYHDWRFSSDS